MVGPGSSLGWFNRHPLHGPRVASAVVLLLVLILSCLDLHAELLYRTSEQRDGRQGWSASRKYSPPLDAAYATVPSRGVVPAQEVRVILSGEITLADVDSAQVMASLIKSGRQKVSGNTVWLASNGGDIDAGMELGRLLRKLGLFTLIDRNDQCLSACVFAFMGGERRSVVGKLGIHRPFFPFTEASDRQARFRHLQRTLKAFVEEMDFPMSFYEAIMLVPPESMQIVEAADLKRFYLDGISPSTEDMVDAAAARRLNISMYEYLQRKSRAPACALLELGQGLCEGRVRQAAGGGSTADAPDGAPKLKATATDGAVGQDTDAARIHGGSRIASRRPLQ